jgi:hypothetical protein
MPWNIYCELVYKLFGKKLNPPPSFKYILGIYNMTKVVVVVVVYLYTERERERERERVYLMHKISVFVT